MFHKIINVSVWHDLLVEDFFDAKVVLRERAVLAVHLVVLSTIVRRLAIVFSSYYLVVSFVIFRVSTNKT